MDHLVSGAELGHGCVGWSSTIVELPCQDLLCPPPPHSFLSLPFLLKGSYMCHSLNTSHAQWLPKYHTNRIKAPLLEISGGREADGFFKGFCNLEKMIHLKEIEVYGQ